MYHPFPQKKRLVSYLSISSTSRDAAALSPMVYRSCLRGHDSRESFAVAIQRSLLMLIAVELRPKLAVFGFEGTVTLRLLVLDLEVIDI
ncbi:hypothetical protein L6164_019626 [Bauhinia variegata]|uniref:Uncharacterized protein n=1 Tax=Bauhinia variegata TaxID=167791 RepID=A0ACB9MSM8_BAUVA|nr:hypothetical protein L6164_019626 [Bauhinia variegata]